MSAVDIVRAWKDAEYRQSLSEAERAQLPDHPAGLIELTDAELEDVAGGVYTLNLSCLPPEATYTIACYTNACSNKCPSSTYSYCGVCLP
jgi:mersacidin/lichenicidin family type 2 lantibiotic